LHIAEIVSIGALPDRHHDTNPGMLRPPRLLLARENFADPRADGRAFLRHRIGLRRTRPSTREIFRNVQQAAQGNLRVSSNITDVQRGASETGSASSQVLSAARALSRRAGAQDRSQQLLTRCALHSSMYIEQLAATNVAEEKVRSSNYATHPMWHKAVRRDKLLDQ
jgi:hypothetical protein